MLARGGDHFLDGQVVRDAGHLRARPHDFLDRAAVEADDLQDDFLFRLRERALLESHFQQFLVIRVGQRRRGDLTDSGTMAARMRGVDFARRCGKVAGELIEQKAAAAPRAATIASGLRTASVLGSTSQPNKSSTAGREG